MFKAKEFPYLLTILISLIGWTVNQISSEILDSKAIGYSIDYYDTEYQGLFKDFKGRRLNVMETKITNLTNNELFKEIELTIEINNAKKTDSLLVREMRPSPPLTFKEKPENTVLGTNTHINVPGLHPRTSVKLLVYYVGSRQPELKLEYSKAGRNDTQAFLLIKSPVEIWILKNKSVLYYSLLCIWLILVIFYFIFHKE